MIDTDRETLARTIRIGLLRHADTIAVTTTSGHIDIAVRADAALRSDLDWFRVIRDDETLIVVHFTSNGVNRGEIRLNGSMSGMLTTVILELVESTF